jgi:hypothetical protein
MYFGVQHPKMHDIKFGHSDLDQNEFEDHYVITDKVVIVAQFEVQTLSSLTHQLRAGMSGATRSLCKSQIIINMVKDICTYIQSRIQFKPKLQDATLPLHSLLSPSSILLPFSPHCAVIIARKIPSRVCKMLLFQFFTLSRTE